MGDANKGGSTSQTACGRHAICNTAAGIAKNAKLIRCNTRLRPEGRFGHQKGTRITETLLSCSVAYFREL